MLLGPVRSFCRSRFLISSILDPFRFNFGVLGRPQYCVFLQDRECSSSATRKFSPNPSYLHSGELVLPCMGQEKSVQSSPNRSHRHSESSNVFEKCHMGPGAQGPGPKGPLGPGPLGPSQTKPQPTSQANPARAPGPLGPGPLGPSQTKPKPTSQTKPKPS